MDDKKFNADSYHVINALFRELEAIFPNFMRAWPNESILKTAKTNWLLAFVEANVNSMRHLQIGLKKARSHPKSWVPTVGEFIEWCKPTMQDYGLPEPQMAFREACKNGYDLKYNADVTWSHPAVYHAGCETGWFEIEKLEKLFLANYEMACRIVFEGGALRDLPKLIPIQPKERSSPETAKRCLSELFQILGKKPKHDI
jgi:hypothetical protein